MYSFVELRYYLPRTKCRMSGSPGFWQGDRKVLFLTYLTTLFEMEMLYIFEWDGKIIMSYVYVKIYKAVVT
jgi:hypothetical protein